MFEHILGNTLLKAYLEKALKSDQLPQTLLFFGIEGIGKSLFAKRVANHLLQSDHSPDLHILAPEGKSGLYAIDTLREMIEKEHAAPFHSCGKVFILEDVERMQPASANALLKTLEEPSPDTQFILLSSNIQEILPTILSRCATLHFQPLSESDIAQLLQEKGFSPHYAKLSSGSLGRALQLAEHPELEEERLILFDLLAKKPSYPDLTLKVDQLEKLVEKEEDPVKANLRVEHLFALILMWHRDQEARKLGYAELFFPDAPKGEPLPLHTVEMAIERGRLAYQRNIKLSNAVSQTIQALSAG
jgi:DNA polymerase-3 subunit delta'